MDLAAAAERIFTSSAGLGYTEVDQAALDHFASSPRARPEVGPYVVGVVGRWIGTGHGPAIGSAFALLLDPESGAAQATADLLAAGAELVEIEGQPCYRYDDGHGNVYLVLCTPAVLLYLVGHDELALSGAAGALFRGWRHDGRA